jgi:prepilin-type N-terminal cleavage/methylation domain-containing protein
MYKMAGEKAKLKDKNRAAGFTLAEVVIASALLAVAIVPILKALTAAHVNTVIIERRTRSLMLAEAKLDEIKARSIYNYGWPGSFTESNSSLDGPYLCSVWDMPQGYDLRRITVSVGYDVNGNNNLSTDEVEVTLVTLVARRW